MDDRAPLDAGATREGPPGPGALSGTSPASVVLRHFLATRPMFFTTSVLPVLVGTGFGYRQGGALDGAAFALALAAVLCVHAAVNVLNDVYDDIGGTDNLNDERIYPYTGGSRFIQSGLMTREEMRRWGLALLGLAALPGALLALDKGVGVLLFGAAGIALGVLYSAPPLHLAARGVGQIAVGIGFGVLPVVGAAWLQSGGLHSDAVLLSLPLGIWAAAVLLINEVPDARADALGGKRTVVVRLGPAGTRGLYVGLQTLALLAILALVWRGLVPAVGTAVPLLFVPAAWVAARAIDAAEDRRRGLRRGIQLTLAIHAIGALWLGAWIWLW